MSVSAIGRAVHSAAGGVALIVAVLLVIPGVPAAAAFGLIVAEPRSHLIARTVKKAAIVIVFRRAAIATFAGGITVAAISVISHVRSSSRSEERRVGKEWVSPCRSRWPP